MDPLEHQDGRGVFLYNYRVFMLFSVHVQSSGSYGMGTYIGGVDFRGQCIYTDIAVPWSDLRYRDLAEPLELW